MINIQLNEGCLDLYTQDIEWSWTSVRFSEGIRDQFTNDFTLPKTTRNVDLLNASGLLDSRSQPLGTQIAPCVLTIGEKTIDAYLQVVSVKQEEISVCLYEKTIPNNIRDTKISELIRNTSDDIYVWNTNSYGSNPYFRKYWYGMGYNTNYAQYHPSKSLNEVIQRVNAAAGINVPNSPSSRYAIATKKTISPQNKIQVIECHWTSDSGNFAVLNGGQHITNDCEWSYSPSNTTITFNRSCKVKGWFYYSYNKKWSVTNDFQIMVCRYNQGQPVLAPAYTIPSSLWDSLVLQDSYQATMQQGSQLRVQCNYLNKYEMLNCVLYLEITDYAITDDDYDQELKYVGRAPRLKVWSDDGQFQHGTHGWRQDASTSGGYTYCYFDATTWATHVHQTGHPNQQQTHAFTLQWCGFAYFGYWQNLPDITVKELMWGSCWADGKKLIQGHLENGWVMEKVLEYRNARDTAIIKGRIVETRPSSDKLGKDNYILMNGQEKSQAAPVSHIDNQWLEDTKELHKSPFAYSVPRYGQWYCIDQYSDPEYNSDSGEYKCKFNDVSGFAVANAGQLPELCYKFTLNTMDFEKMVQSVEVDIETYDDVKDLDFVFLDGHKYMIIEGSTDMKTGFSKVKALLMPYYEELTEPTAQHPEPPEEQYEDDHEEGHYPDPNDDFEPEGDHPDYDNGDPLINWGNEPVDPWSQNQGDEDPGDYDYEGDDPYEQWA